MRDDGILTFYRLVNAAEPGRMPVEQLSADPTTSYVDVGVVGRSTVGREINQAYYSRRTIGVTRMYAAAGANRRVDVLVRCHNTPGVPDGCRFVVLEDNKQYRIDAVQELPDLDAVDLSLVRLEEFYDIADETVPSE